MSFSGWLRRNSERYLLEAAQRDVARRHGVPPPKQKGGGPMAFFWRRIFVPVYRLLPWSLRRWIMHMMPGSHRRRWEERAPPAPPRTAVPAGGES